MKHTFKISILLIALTLITACGDAAGQDASSAQPATQDQSYKKFESKKLGVSFEVPASWAATASEDAPAGKLFIQAKDPCTGHCDGLFLDVLTQKNYAYGYLVALRDFGVDTSDAEKKENLGTSVSDAVAAEKNNPALTPTQISGGAMPALSYTADNKIHIYNNKDTIYSIQIEDMSLTNLASVYEHIVATFQEMPAEVTAAFTPSTTSKEYPFDSCGPLSKYTAEDFYQKYLDQLKTIPLSRMPSAIKANGTATIAEKDVSEVCFSKAQGVMIALIQGQYCELGEMVKYDVPSGKATLANDEPARTKAATSCYDTLKDFGKRQGAFINLKGETGDAGGHGVATYKYYYDENVLDLDSVCAGAVGQEKCEKK